MKREKLIKKPKVTLAARVDDLTARVTAIENTIHPRPEPPWMPEPVFPPPPDPSHPLDRNNL